MSIFEILRTYDHNGMLGQLTGVTLTERDRLFQGIYKDLSAQLEQAREQAKQNGKPLELDCSALSGVNHGDTWTIDAQGKVARQLSAFPDFEPLLRQVCRHIDAPHGCNGATAEHGALGSDEALRRLRPLLARCAYNGLWSPSGTNWQPTRTVELTHADLARMAAAAPTTGLPMQSQGGLALLARTDYESMLGDVAKIARFELRSQAEYIDAGIFSLSCELTSQAAGCPAATAFAAEDQRSPLTQALAAILRDRLGPADASLRDQTERLLEAIKLGEYVFDGLFCPAAADCQPPVAFTAVDQLIAARCSQRVASPQRTLPADTLEQLWATAIGTVEPDVRQHLRYACFSWTEQAPRDIGQAMFDGLYGVGADPDSGDGGRGGIINNITIESMVAYLKQCEGDLPPDLHQLASAAPNEREALASSTPLPGPYVPRRLREFILSKPQFRLQDDNVVGRNEQVLTVEQFLRMVRMLAHSFGRFFLSFQNTHPLTAVILPRKVDDLNLHARIYRGVGRVVQALSLLCRARGLVSIIKGGPTEINRPGVGEVVARHGHDPALRQAVARGEFLASLTFQIGYPLGPDETVIARNKQHSGLTERIYDKRSPRARVSEHYFPAPQT